MCAAPQFSLAPLLAPFPVHVDGFDAGLRLERFFEQVDTLDDEASFVFTRTAAPYKAPQPLDPLVPVGKAAHTSADPARGGRRRG